MCLVIAVKGVDNYYAVSFYFDFPISHVNCFFIERIRYESMDYNVIKDTIMILNEREKCSIRHI